MEEPGYNNRRERARELHDRAHDLEHAIKRMEHDMRHADRERMHAIKDAFKNNIKSNMAYAAGRSPASAGPRTVEEVLVEIDSYISYLEDLPKEQLVPHEGKIESVALHMEKVKNAIKNK